MAIDWDKLQVKVIDDDHIPITDDYKYTMSSEQRMVIFAGRRGEQGPAGPAGPAGPSGASSWGAIEGDIENQTDLANALDEKINDAPSDNKEYVRKNGAWTESSGGGGGSETPTWGEITGTLSDQTDLQNALNAKANVADLGDLATQDTVDYQTEVTNKPTLGTMASVNDAPSDSKEYVRKNGAWAESSGGGGGGITSVSWGDINGTLANQTDLQTALSSKANTSDLGDLAYEDDAPSDNAEYVRKNGSWAVSSGGGGGGGTPTWGSITGTMSQQTDLQTALDEKAPVIIDRIPATKSGVYVVVSRGEEIIDLKATYNVTQTGSGTPSASNIRPFVSAEKAIVMLAVSYEVLPPEYISQNIQLPSTIYGGIVDVINGELTITHGHIASYNGETLSGVWYSDRDEYVAGTTPTVGAEVVYELETPVHQSFTGRTPRPFQSRDTYMWVTHAQNIETNYTVTAVISHEGAVDTKTYIDQGDALKANTADLGDLAYEDDAPSDNAEYVRKNGSWAVSSGGGGTTTPTWGNISGTLSDQTDLATALNGKQNVLTIDSTPTASSTNPVESGGVKTALDAKQDTLTFDTTPTANSANPVTSGGIKTYVDSHDDFKIAGTVSSSGYTLTDSRINDEHWEVDWIQFTTESHVMTGVNWSTDIVNHTVTLSATYSGSTIVVVNMHWVQ